MNDNEKEFNYTYSAEQQQEIKSILEKYTPTEESPMDIIKHLDKCAERPGKLVSMTVGTVGTLVFGAGMSCITEFQEYFVFGMAIGIAIGIVGIAAIISAYPLFKIITKKQREKIAPQIIELSSKLI